MTSHVKKVGNSLNDEWWYTSERLGLEQGHGISSIYVVTDWFVVIDQMKLDKNLFYGLGRESIPYLSKYVGVKHSVCKVCRNILFSIPCIRKRWIIYHIEHHWNFNLNGTIEIQISN